MHKTIYIDTEEEIIGIIDKIRKEESPEIFLVVPKNSLLTQGIVNLKLLKKEVDKMGKHIILVTSDQHSRRIIKAVGLEAKNKSAQDFIKEETPEKEEASKKKETSEKIIGEEVVPPVKKKKREIGSSDFYSSSMTKPDKENLFEEEIEEPALEPPKPKSSTKIKIKTPNSFGKEFIENHENQKKIEKKKLFSRTLRAPKLKPEKPRVSSHVSIDDFYQEKTIQKTPEINPIEKKERKKISFNFPKKIKVFPILATVFVAGAVILGYWVFLNWPKMKAQLYLNKHQASASSSIMVCEDVEIDSNCSLKGSYKEILIETSDKYPATGEKFSNDKGMARGTVKIYNHYSSSNQSLVATTRLLSKEGKLFRLIKNVVVPGKNGDEPGMIEAQVIADKIGQSYNIEASEFTIEGFKGGDKYDKFKVISEEKMTGGANDTENKKVKIVTESDINLAREKSIKSFNESLEENIKKNLEEGETFAYNSIEKEIIFNDSSYAPGDIIDQFNYKIKEKIKVITFNETEFQKILQSSFDEESQDDLVFEKISDIKFMKDVADYSAKKLDLNVTAKGDYWPVLDENILKNELSEKNNEGIKEYLSSLEQINRAVLLYSPSWLSSMPVKKGNVIIEKNR